jgi:hypothetical protein
MKKIFFCTFSLFALTKISFGDIVVKGKASYSTVFGTSYIKCKGSEGECARITTSTTTSSRKSSSNSEIIINGSSILVQDYKIITSGDETIIVISDSQK